MDILIRETQIKRVGPGGIKCPCCCDYHSKHDRYGKRHYSRLARRKLKQQLNVEIDSEPNDLY